MNAFKYLRFSWAALLVLMAAPASFAQTFDFSFTDGSVMGTGWVDLSGGVATSGSITVTNAAYDGTLSLVTAGSYPSVVTNPNGDNISYDNAVSPLSDPALTGNGLAFASGYIGTAGNGYPEYNAVVNLWGNGPGNYSMFEGEGPQGSNVYVTYNNGTMSFEAVPEPSTYAAIVGAAALGFALIRRKRLLA